MVVSITLFEVLFLSGARFGTTMSFFVTMTEILLSTETLLNWACAAAVRLTVLWQDCHCHCCFFSLETLQLTGF